MQALGFIEVSGVVAAIDALDLLCKAASVRFVTWERKLGGRLVTVVVEGPVADVTEAIEAARAHCVAPIRASNVIANPHPETVRLVELSASRLQKKTDPQPPAPAPEPAPAAGAAEAAESKPAEGSAPKTRAPRKASAPKAAAPADAVVTVPAPAAQPAAEATAETAAKPARRRTPSKELSQDALAAALAHALGQTGGNAGGNAGGKK